MNIGIIGLGKMGGNIARRLARGGIQLAAFDAAPQVAQALQTEGVAQACDSVAQLVGKLDATQPKVVWLMLPAGEVTENTLALLKPLLRAGDVVVEGANSYYKDSKVRARTFSASGIEFVDCGVSGGVWGLENGYALMFGGSEKAAAIIAPIIKILAPAPDAGWLHCGPAGAGHYTKMIHNGIEYGMMQAYAEGLALMQGKTEFDLDTAKITEMWRHSSVVRSWLLDLIAQGLAKEGALDGVAPFVADSGEGRWTAIDAIEQGIPAPVMSLALMNRFSTQGKGDFSAQLLAMMRNQFGGHSIKKS